STKHDLLAGQHPSGRAHDRDQSAVAVGLDRRDRRANLHGAHRREAGRASGRLGQGQIERVTVAMATPMHAPAETAEARRAEDVSNASLGPTYLGPRGVFRRREALAGILMVAPAILLVAVVIWYPVTQTVRYSFTDWNGSTANWVGLENYTDVLTGPGFWEPLRNNLIFL